MQPIDANARRQEIRRGLGRISRALPEPMRAFGDLHQAAMTDGALSRVDKELIALAISVCGHCGDCIVVHVHDAIRAGATDAQLDEALAVAIAIGGGPATMYAAEARRAIEEFRAIAEQ